MEAITNFFTSVKNAFDSIPDILVGILLLILAFVVAGVAKKIFTGILSKTKLVKNIDAKAKPEDGKRGPGTEALDIVGKLLFLVIFLLFLPASLDKFGMTGVTEPITNLVDSFMGYVPNIIACALILLIGFFIANLVRQIIAAALNLAKLEKLQEKLTKGKVNINIGKILATIAYIFIVVIAVICAFNVLGIEAISTPATGMLNSIIGVIPSLIVAVVMLVVGVFLGNLVATLLESLLESFDIDAKINKWLGGNKPMSLTKILVTVVKAIIILVFAMEAVKALNFSVLTDIGTAILGYLPSALVAVIVALIAFVACKLIDSKLTVGSAFVKTVIKTVVIVVAVFIALSQLNIAPTIVNTTFLCIIGALAVVIAIAGGVGAIPFVRNLLANTKIGKKNSGDDNK